MVKSLMLKASTRTGLRVFVDILDRYYEIGLKLPNFIRDSLRIRFDRVLPVWNYVVVPTPDAEYWGDCEVIQSSMLRTFCIRPVAKWTSAIQCAVGKPQPAACPPDWPKCSRNSPVSDMEKLEPSTSHRRCPNQDRKRG